MNRYYHSLLLIEKYIKKSNKVTDDLIMSIRDEVSIINKHSLEKHEELQLYFISDTKNNELFKNSINSLYEISFGIDMSVLNVLYLPNKKNEKMEKF